ALDHRPVRDRIGERHAELDRIRAGAHKLFDDARRRGGVGIAARDVRDHAASRLGAEMFEETLDAIHVAPPPPAALAGAGATFSSAATCGTSLSPRPLRLAITIASFGIPLPNRSSHPTAWADSSAGMIPSVSLNLWNASSARSSLQS